MKTSVEACGRARKNGGASGQAGSFTCETSAAGLATGTVVLPWAAAARALLRVVEIGERRVKVPPKRRAFKIAFAVSVEPGAEALQVDAAASDGPVAMKAVGASDRAPEGAVLAPSCVPVAGEAVAAVTSPTDRGADHVNRSVRHRLGILNRRAGQSKVMSNRMKDRPPRPL
jgi:hypothetical protein